MSSRFPWLDDRAALLVRYLSEQHRLTITADVARADLSDQLDFTAERMRIGRQAAKRYITDEFIHGFGDHIAAAVTGQRPPTNLDEYRARRQTKSPPA